ncbi:hypothetical protein JB92DRAFT_2929211 [Gautieria morchelliformis]|nr:hypothetical protein JB92DRAFT_2929211 [Gautieria morchelliformis]
MQSKKLRSNRDAPTGQTDYMETKHWRRDDDVGLTTKLSFVRTMPCKLFLISIISPFGIDLALVGHRILTLMHQCGVFSFPYMAPIAACLFKPLIPGTYLFVPSGHGRIVCCLRRRLTSTNMYYNAPSEAWPDSVP